MEVELPDGRVVEIDTADPAVAASAAKKFLDKNPANSATTKWRVTAPDGSVYDTIGPAGATAQDAIDYVQKQHAETLGAAVGSGTGIARFRQQYPEYNDLPDAVLADKLYQKFYSDMPREQFDAKMGVGGPSSGSWKLPNAPVVPTGGNAPTGTPIGAARDVPRLNADMDPAVRNLLQGAQGAGAGLAHLAGAPVDLTTLLLNTLAAGADKAGHATGAYEGTVGRITNPVGGSQSIMAAGRALTKPLMDAIDYTPVEPKDLPFGERLIYNVNDLGTQTLGFAGAVNRGAQAAEEGGTLLGRTVERYLRSMAEPYTEGAANAEAATTGAGRAYEAARPWLIDQASSAGAATGLTAAEGQTDSPIAQFLAMMVGAFGGAGAARVIGSPAGAARMAKNHFGTDYNIPADPETGRYTSPFVASRTRATMQGAAVNPEAAAGNISEGAEFYRDAGMPRPTTGLMSNDEGLIALERAARTKNPVPFAQRDRAVNQAATEKIQSLSPGENVDARQFTDTLKRQVTDQLDAASAKISALEGKIANLEDQAGGYGSAAAARTELAGDASKRLDTAVVDKTLRPMAAKQNKLYRGIDPTGEVQRDVAPLLEAVKDLERAVPEGVPADEVLPGKWLSTIKSLAAKEVDTGLVDSAGNTVTRTEGGTIPFKDLNEMRPFLSKAISSARQRGDYARADSLRTIKSFIDFGSRARRGGRRPGRRAGARRGRFHQERDGPDFRPG